MCRNWCEYRYDAIELSKAYVCIWIPLSHRDKEMWVVPRLARKRGMGKCQGDCGIPQPGLQSEDMPQKPLDISTLLFYPRAEEQQESLPGEQPRDADAARIHKSVRVCSRMVHHKIPRTKLRGIFYCLFLRELLFPCSSGDENGLLWRRPPPAAVTASP